jgi:hypothetical protein
MTSKAEMLAALNIACCLMGGSEDGLQTFCAGFSSGLSACLEAIGYDEEAYLSPSSLGADSNKKIMAAAMSVIDHFNRCSEKDAVYEAMTGGAPKRTEFRKDALELYAAMSKEKGEKYN